MTGNLIRHRRASLWLESFQKAFESVRLLFHFRFFNQPEHTFSERLYYKPPSNPNTMRILLFICIYVTITSTTQSTRPASSDVDDLKLRGKSVVTVKTTGQDDTDLESGVNMEGETKQSRGLGFERTDESSEESLPRLGFRFDTYNSTSTLTSHDESPLGFWRVALAITGITCGSWILLGLFVSIPVSMLLFCIKIFGWPYSS